MGLHGMKELNFVEIYSEEILGRAELMVSQRQVTQVSYSHLTPAEG